MILPQGPGRQPILSLPPTVLPEGLHGGLRQRQRSPRPGRLGVTTLPNAALTSLPEADQARLGVTAGWKAGPHQLTCRQVEHTCRLITRALAGDEPGGAPSGILQAACDQLLEASIPDARKNASKALAADWSDVETWSRPPRHGSTECAISAHGSAEPSTCSLHPTAFQFGHVMRYQDVPDRTMAVRWRPPQRRRAAG
jgi:hypothetical protein